MYKSNMTKMEYIANQLRRASYKKYENYCITRIFHILNPKEDAKIQIITQKMFKRKNGKISLADLYLPQINMIIEINERYHKNNIEKDKKRQKERDDYYKKLIQNKKKALEEVIEENKKLIDEKIKVYSGDLKDINNKINKIIEKIKLEIKKLGNRFKPWELNNKTYKEYINEGKINAKDDVSFKTIWEISNLFNKGYKLKSRTAYFKTSVDNERVWCPTLELETGDCKKNRYENNICEDGSIKEQNKENKNEYKNSAYDNEQRITFLRYRDDSGERRYKFKGIYKLDRKLTNKRKARIWVRCNEKVDLTKYFFKNKYK